MVLDIERIRLDDFLAIVTACVHVDLQDTKLATFEGDESTLFLRESSERISDTKATVVTAYQPIQKRVDSSAAAAAEDLHRGVQFVALLKAWDLAIRILAVRRHAVVGSIWLLIKDFLGEEASQVCQTAQLRRRRQRSHILDMLEDSEDLRCHEAMFAPLRDFAFA